MPLIPILLAGLGTFGPDIVKWIAGDKAGAAAQIAMDKAKEILGTDDPAQLEEAIKRDPNLALQYAMALLSAKTESERVAAERERATQQAEMEQLRTMLEDVRSARSMGVAYAGTKSMLMWGAPIISALSLVLAGAVAYLIMFPNASAAKWTETVVMMLAGAAIGWVNQVLNYWLGSSMGSQHKDTMMSDLKGMMIRGSKP